jgi:hypothetical protein
MKRALTVMACAAAAIIVLAMSQAGARAQGAIVISDGHCGLLDGDGNFAIGDVHSVTNSGGITNYTCTAKKVSNTNRKAVDYDYTNTALQCGTPGGITTDWSENVSASGNATLHCHVKN